MQENLRTPNCHNVDILIRYQIEIFTYVYLWLNSLKLGACYFGMAWITTAKNANTKKRSKSSAIISIYFLPNANIYWPLQGLTYFWRRFNITHYVTKPINLLFIASIVAITEITNFDFILKVLAITIFAVV